MTASSFNHWVGTISLARDRDTGRIFPDPDDGRIRMSYTPSAFDTAHILEGIIGAAKINFVMGAREINSPNFLVPNWIRKDDGTAETSFQKWIDQLRLNGVSSPYPCTMLSAHQMGTCGMSSNAQEGVVDQSGKVWGSEGLYVSDASVFPSASGVNPMLTTMGISDWISRGIAKDMTK